MSIPHFSFASSAPAASLAFGEAVSSTGVLNPQSSTDISISGAAAPFASTGTFTSANAQNTRAGAFSFGSSCIVAGGEHRFGTGGERAFAVESSGTNTAALLPAAPGQQNPTWNFSFGSESAVSSNYSNYSWSFSAVTSATPFSASVPSATPPSLFSPSESSLLFSGSPTRKAVKGKRRKNLDTAASDPAITGAEPARSALPSTAPSATASFEPVLMHFQFSDQQIFPCAISCYSSKNVLVVASDGQIYRYSAGKFSLVEGLPQQKFSKVSCGQGYYLAVDSCGVLYAWGKIEDGRLGVGRHFPDLQILARETTSIVRVLFAKSSKPMVPEALSRCLESKALASLLGFDCAVLPDGQDIGSNATRKALRAISNAFLCTEFGNVSDIDRGEDFIKDAISTFLRSYIPEPQHLYTTPKSVEAELISSSRSVLEGLICFCRSMPDTRPLLTKSSSIQDVGEWLKAQGVNIEIIKKFEQEKIDGSLLVTLAASDLSRMGLNKLGPRKALYTKIQELNSTQLGFVSKKWIQSTDIYRFVRMVCLNLEAISGFHANVRKSESETKNKGKLVVGNKVMLSHNYTNYGDAKDGPLAPGEIGILVQDDLSSKPYRVEAKGRRWWYHREAIVAASEMPASTELSKENIDLSQQAWLKQLVKQVLNLAGHLISVVGEYEVSDDPLNRVGAFHLRDAISSLVSSSAKIAAQIPGCGVGFLSPVLSKLSGHVLEGVQNNSWLPDLPEDLTNMACVSFMECIKSSKQALAMVFPSLADSASYTKDHSAVTSVIHSILGFLRSELDFSKPPLPRPRGMYVALCHIQTALLFPLSVKYSPDKGTQMDIIHRHWIESFMHIWKDFLLIFRETVKNIFPLTSFSKIQDEVRKLEDRMNSSLFRPLLPILIFGLESCDWSFFPPSLVSGLHEIHTLMKDVVGLVPEWRNANIALDRQLWRAPSHFCKWFITSLHMIQALVFRKPFEMRKASEAASKWLDKGFIMTPGRDNVKQSSLELLDNEEFWGKVEALTQTNLLLVTKFGRLVKHATAVLAYHSAENSDSYQMGDPQDICQVFKNCSKAVAHWASKVRAESDDIENACARALFLFEIAPMCGSISFKAADEFFEDMLEEETERPLLRRNSSRSLNDSALSAWILEFIFDKNVDPTNIRQELNRRNQHLESCMAAIRLLGLDCAEQLIDNYRLIGEFLSAASRDRKHYLDGYGGAAVDLQKKFQTAFLGVLGIALNAQPDENNCDLACSYYGAFSALAVLKLNYYSIKLLLELRIWDVLVDLQNKDQLVDTVKLGSLESLNSLVLPMMICFVIEAFQDLKLKPHNIMEWRRSILNGLMRFLKSDAAEKRTGLDLLALCTADARQFNEAIEYCSIHNSPISVQMVACLYHNVIPSLHNDKLSEQGKSVSCMSASFSFLSKIAQCLNPNIFDSATREYSFAFENKLVGGLPAGLRFLLVLTSMLGDCVEWEPPSAVNTPPLTSPSNRLILSEGTANFLAKLGRNTSWHEGAKLFCGLFLSPETSKIAGVDLEMDVRLRLCGITLSLCMLGGWIPVVQEGGDARNLEDESVAVLQYKLGSANVLIAKQDGSLHWVRVDTLSPLSAKSGILSSFKDLSLLLPFIQWHLHRVLSESESRFQRAAVLEDTFMGVMTECSNKLFYFGRRQGTMVMKILADLAMVCPAGVYGLLANQGEQSAINALNQVALFCPEVEDFSNLQLTMHRLAGRALALQCQIFNWLSTNTEPTIIGSKRLSILQRKDTLGKVEQVVGKIKEPNSNTPAQALPAYKTQGPLVVKADVVPDEIGVNALDIDSIMLDLSGVHRDLMILYSVNVAIELLPDYLGASLTASLDQESKAHVIMRLLQLASCIGVSSGRIENVLGRLLSSTAHGLPQFFLQVILNASNPDKWVPQNISAPLKIIQSMENMPGNSANWESTLSFVGSSAEVKSVHPDPAFALTMLGNGARVRCENARRTDTTVILEAQGSSAAIAESSHNYLDNVKYRGHVRIEGAQGLRVEFDHRCQTESNCDPMAFFIDEEFLTKIHEYSGAVSEVSWKDFNVEDKDTLYYTFSSDGSRNEWGYR